jgi:hypothetical protein
MANSRRFRQLESELNRLRKNFLPRNWSPTGIYSERTHDHTRAYRVFAHAEIESFIENILLKVIDEKYTKWKTTKKPNYAMICLLAASKLGWQDTETVALGLIPIEPPKIKKDDESIHQFIDRAFKQYQEIVDENHGIQKQNIKRLLMPLGIALTDLDETWLNNMNSFGGQRGFVAHTSRLGVTNLPDPKTEKDTVDNLLTGLQVLDDLVLKLKRQT